jgi:hypothetical protein
MLVNETAILSVCLSTPSNQLLNQFVNTYEIQNAGHATEYELDTITFNPVAPITQKWRIFKILR